MEKKNRQRGKCLPAEAHPNCNLLLNYEWQKTRRQRAEAGPYLCVCVETAFIKHISVHLVSLRRGEQTGNNKEFFFFFCLLHSSERQHDIMCHRVRQDGSFSFSRSFRFLSGYFKEEMMWDTHSHQHTHSLHCELLHEHQPAKRASHCWETFIRTDACEYLSQFLGTFRISWQNTPGKKEKGSSRQRGEKDIRAEQSRDWRREG